jgi:hypothetical protein
MVSPSFKRVPGIAVAALAIGCGGGSSNPVVPVVPAVAGPPSIVSVSAQPPSVAYGEQAIVTVVAADPSSGSLSFSYKADHGRVIGNGSVTVYLAPPASSLDIFDVVHVAVSNAAGSTDTALGIGLGGNPPPASTPPRPVPVSSGSPSPPNTVPAPRPTAPTLRVSSGRCHPYSPSEPCTVTLTATSSGGGPLTYSWSGCTTSSGAACNVSIHDLMDHAVSCTVSSPGGTATSSGVATGVLDTAPAKIGGNGCGSVPVGGAGYVTVQVGDDSARGHCNLSGVSGPCAVTISDCSYKVVQAKVTGKPPGQGYCGMTLAYVNVWNQALADVESCLIQ